MAFVYVGRIYLFICKWTCLYLCCSCCSRMVLAHLDCSRYLILQCAECGPPLLATAQVVRYSGSWRKGSYSWTPVPVLRKFLVSALLHSSEGQGFTPQRVNLSLQCFPLWSNLLVAMLGHLFNETGQALCWCISPQTGW